GERGRIAGCARNLAKLGQAVASDTADHSDGFPAAGISIGKTRLGWDMELAPYVQSGATNATSVYDKKQFLKAAAQSFQCPSDTLPHDGATRSYAMAACSMLPEDLLSDKWPPRPESKTGIGAWWDKTTVHNLLDPKTAPDAMLNPELLPRLKSSIVLQPANTLLVTELFATNNALGSLSRTRVWNLADQRGALDADSNYAHFRKLNYLMADGHVELLSGLQSKGIAREPIGIWTIKAGD
ncbi:MAG TPA: hypothetical protein VFC07_02130, partial [Verrucomicrobiae bacterium]|nr:hypothetical protein [Verrucomicrobiae bacterium]